MKSIILTKQADCKDCYRCLRNCPVKAISFTTEKQAKVNDERCIICGKCVIECPQNAKIISDDTAEVIEYLKGPSKVVLSIAPSFPASFSIPAEELFNILENLGFDAVEETAWGAMQTVAAYHDILQKSDDRTWLSSCCPVIVNLVEKYYPELLSHLMPVASPMVVHSRQLKEHYGRDCKVVFAGPCIAKLQEAHENGVDAALTFRQLKGIMSEASATQIVHQKKTDLKTRLFPINGGVLFAMKGHWDFAEEFWSVDGIEQCREVLEALKNNEIKPRFIELMACEGGCVGGPGMDGSGLLINNKQKVMNYYHKRNNKTEPDISRSNEAYTAKKFKEGQMRRDSFTEEQIKAVMRKMGKFTKDDERNCEGCGYKSCREKAIAVLSGHAVSEMCIPYMKEKAESFANTIVQNTPNAIIVLDEHMNLMDFNPSAQRIFAELYLEKGLNMEKYLDTSTYKQVLKKHEPIVVEKRYYPALKLRTREVISSLDDNNMVMAIITDISSEEEKQLQMQKIKEDVMVKAKEVISRQMMVAQTIAGLLGETTADTKATLYELLKHLESE